MARPTKLTPELRERLLTLLRASVPLSTAAPILGISRKTLANWVKRAATEETGKFHDLGLDIEQAQAQARLPYITAIAKSGRTNTKDAKWMLERSDPEHWERKRPVEAEIDGTTPEETAAQICSLVAAMQATVPKEPPADYQAPAPSESPDDWR
jgi:hypothetical protein